MTHDLKKYHNMSGLRISDLMPQKINVFESGGVSKRMTKRRRIALVSGATLVAAGILAFKVI